MQRPMRVIHCFRAPLGGLFRHVCDLVQGQAEAGLEVGILCDEGIGGEAARDTLQSIECVCALGVHRIEMPRLISAADISAANHLTDLTRHFGAEILHGHGAKGGAYARISAFRNKATAVYTPHGGSLHYSWSSPAGFLFLSLERLLTYRTHGIIFESAYSRDTFTSKITRPGCPTRVIPNGLRPDEFKKTSLKQEPADFLFVGELRELKGVDLLLRALAIMNSAGKRATAVVVGSGPDDASFRSLARDLGIDDAVHFAGALPAREAFSLGRTLVVPSRAESFPYIVLEAAAAQKPIISTRVGGIPEIFGPVADQLVTPDNVDALRSSLETAMDDPAATTRNAERLAEHVAARFTTQGMVAAATAFYSEIGDRNEDGTDACRFTATAAE